MKKLMSLVFAMVAVFALSGCEGGSDDSNGNTYDDVYLSDLEQGYAIKGYNNFNEEITLKYCGDEYDYYRDDEEFHGTFVIDYDEIEMTDDTGGSYVLYVDSELLEVEETYDCDALGRDLTVEEISVIDC